MSVKTPSNLLVLAAGLLQVPAIITAKRMGLRVIALDGDPLAYGLRLADASYVVNIQDAEACLAIAQREQVDGVVHICSEVSMHAMGRVNEVLGLHGVDVATAIRATDKEKMRRAFEAGGAPSPRSVGVATEEDVVAAARVVGWPLIVKPSRSSGSRGITRLAADAGQVKLLAAFHHAVDESRDCRAVVEEFVDGPEFSVEILTWNGESRVLAVTDKVTTGAPHFVETGHSQPTRFTESERRMVEGAAIKGVKALGIDWAAAHAEVRLSSGGAVLMEIGARLGGDFITTELVPRSTGIDMVEGAIRLALGQIPDLIPRHPPHGAAIRYLIPKAGKVISIDGLEYARNTAGVRAVELDARIGEAIPECTSSLSRTGHVIAEAPSAGEAVAIAEAARDAIRIITE